MKSLTAAFQRTDLASLMVGAAWHYCTGCTKRAIINSDVPKCVKRVVGLSVCLFCRSDYFQYLLHMVLSSSVTLAGVVMGNEFLPVAGIGELVGWVGKSDNFIYKPLDLFCIVLKLARINICLSALERTRCSRQKLKQSSYRILLTTLLMLWIVIWTKKWCYANPWN